MSNQPFDGKVVIVTGGASVIGEACVNTFAHAGAKVVIADLNSELGERTAAAIQKAGGNAKFIQVDVSNPDTVEQMVSTTIMAFGKLDICVNNAGISGDEFNLTGDYSIESWRRMIDVNLNSVFYCMRYEIPRMLEHGSGAIVNVASAYGIVASPYIPAYVTAKHGVIGLTKAAALEYGTQGIRVNAVAPGFIKTRFASFDDDTFQAISAKHALGRFGEAQEVANMVSFLCSDQASFLTGGCYMVDGGYTAQ